MGRKKLTAGRDPKIPFVCYVCGDTARGNNFSVLSCVSCKSFFRRCGHLNLEKLQCRYNGNCVVMKETRADCQCCRLKKCLSVGMDPLMIRSALEQPTTTNQMQIQLPPPKPLGLLQNDRSSLTTDQWDLLSNIIRSYDEQNLIIRVKCLLNEASSLPPKLRTKAGNTINLISQSMIAMQPLIEQSPHFRHSSNHARRALMLNNVYLTSSINGCFVARESDAFNNVSFMTGCSVLYGSDFMMSRAQENERLESNGSVIKLMLFVLIFSSNCSIVIFNEQEDIDTVSCSIEMIHIQDMYVTMLWKYLVYLYGNDQAAFRFLSLVQLSLNTLRRFEELAKNLAYNVLLNKILTETERSLAITD